MNKIFNKNIEYIIEIEKINNNLNHNELFDLLNNIKEHLLFERNSSIIQTFLIKFFSIYFKINENLKIIFLSFFKSISFTINFIYSFETLENYIIETFKENNENVIHICELLLSIRLYKVKNLTNFNIFLYTIFLNIKNLNEREIIRGYLKKLLKFNYWNKCILNSLNPNFYLVENQFLNWLYLLECYEFNNIVDDILIFKQIMRFVEKFENCFNDDLLNIMTNFYKKYMFDIDVYLNFLFINNNKFKPESIKRVLFLLLNKTVKKNKEIEDFLSDYTDYYYNLKYNENISIDLEIITQINFNRIKKKYLFNELLRLKDIKINRIFIIYLNRIINYYYNFYKLNLNKVQLKSIISSLENSQVKNDNILILIFSLHKWVNNDEFWVEHNIFKANYCIEYLNIDNYYLFNDFDKDIISCHLIFKKIINKEISNNHCKNLILEMKKFLKILRKFDKLYYQYFLNFLLLVILYFKKFVKNIKDLKYKINYNKNIVYSFDLLNLNKNLEFKDLFEFVNSNYFLKIRKNFFNKNLYNNELEFEIMIPKTISLSSHKINIVTVYFINKNHLNYIKLNVKSKLQINKNMIYLDNECIEIDKNNNYFNLRLNINEKIIDSMYINKYSNYLKLQFDIYIDRYFFNSISKDIKIKY